MGFNHKIGDAVIVTIGKITIDGIVRGIYVDEHSNVNYYVRTVSNGGEVSDRYFKESEVSK